MSTDLRQKLAVLFACRCDPAWIERKLHAPSCIEELQDDVVDIVADWLRDRAMIEERDGQGDISLNRWAADTLREAADSITTPKGEHGGS